MSSEHCNALLAEQGLILETDVTKGRCVYTSVPIKRGEVIFKSRPFASSVFIEKLPGACSNCLLSFAFPDSDKQVKALRCSKCKETHYCSPQCQKRHWPIHKAECRHLPQLIKNALQIGVPPFLLCNIILATRVLRRASDDVAVHCDETGHIVPGFQEVDAMCEVDRLVLTTDEGPTEEAIQLQVLEGVLSLVPQSYWGGASEATRSPTAVARLLRKFQCNNFAFCDPLLHPVAAAVFPFGALLNHSCCPNSVLMHDQGTQIVRALRDIEPGEELLHSYVDVCASTVDRQRGFLDNFDFRCQCDRCKRMSCVKADGSARFGDHLTSDEVSLDAVMHQDKNGAPCRPLVTKPEDLHFALREAVDFYNLAAAEADVEKEYELVLKAFEAFDRHLHRYNLDRYTVLGSLATVAMIRGSAKDPLQCVGFHSELVSLARTYYWHVPSHPLLGLYLVTLSELLAEAACANAAAVAREALSVCTVSYGSQHPIPWLVSALTPTGKLSATNIKSSEDFFNAVYQTEYRFRRPPGEPETYVAYAYVPKKVRFDLKVRLPSEESGSEGDSQALTREEMMEDIQHHRCDFGIGREEWFDIIDDSKVYLHRTNGRQSVTTPRQPLHRFTAASLYRLKHPSSHIRRRYRQRHFLPNVSEAACCHRRLPYAVELENLQESPPIFSPSEIARSLYGLPMWTPPTFFVPEPEIMAPVWTPEEHTVSPKNPYKPGMAVRPRRVPRLVKTSKVAREDLLHERIANPLVEETSRPWILSREHLFRQRFAQAGVWEPVYKQRTAEFFKQHPTYVYQPPSGKGHVVARHDTGFPKTTSDASLTLKLETEVPVRVAAPLDQVPPHDVNSLVSTRIALRSREASPKRICNDPRGDTSPTPPARTEVEVDDRRTRILELAQQRQRTATKTATSWTQQASILAPRKSPKTRAISSS